MADWPTRGETPWDEKLKAYIDEAAAGIAVQELTPVESALLTPGNYTYDVQVMLPNGRIFTPILGESEEIVGDITHAITPAGE